MLRRDCADSAPEPKPMPTRASTSTIEAENRSTRLTLDLDPDLKAQTIALARKKHMTQSGLCRDGLKLLIWIEETRQPGQKVAFVDSDGRIASTLQGERRLTLTHSSQLSQPDQPAPGEVNAMPQPKPKPKPESKPEVQTVRGAAHRRLLSYVAQEKLLLNDPHPRPWLYRLEESQRLKASEEELELRARIEDAWPALLKLWLDTYGTNPVPSERLFFLLFEKPNYPPGHDPEQDPEVELQIFCDVLARHLMDTYTIDDNQYQQKFGGQSTLEGVTYTLALIPKAIR